MKTEEEVKQMNKEEIVRQIEGLFPADTVYPDTKRKGQELLMEAIFENWREFPLSVLITYKVLCEREEQRQVKL